MSKATMIGCDLHDRNILLKVAVGRSKPCQMEFRNDCKGRCKMITALKKIASEKGNGQIVFVYEASGLGHGLSDQLDEAGIVCHVISPNQLPKTPKSPTTKLWTKAHIREIRKSLMEQLEFSLATKLDLLLKRLEYYLSPTSFEATLDH